MSNQGPMTEAMYYVLLVLSRPQHGYAIMAAIKEASDQRLVIGPGTLYGVLSRLQKDQLISLDEDDGRRKTYSLTERGRNALQQEHQRLVAMVRDGNSYLGGGGER